jgi:hypothetical protein
MLRESFGRLLMRVWEMKTKSEEDRRSMDNLRLVFLLSFLLPVSLSREHEA